MPTNPLTPSMNSIFRHKLTLSLHRNTLVIHLPGGAVRRAPLQPGAQHIGRASNNEIVIEHDTVSRRHARLTFENGNLFIEDLASTRGTWIGETRLKPYQRTPWQPDKSLWIGQTEVRFERLNQVHIPTILIWAPLLVLAVVVSLVVWLNNRPVNLVCEPPNYAILLPESAPVAQVEPTPVEAEASPTPDGGTEIAGEPSPTPEATAEFVAPQDYPSLAFLDLPFPYDGGNTNYSGTLDQFVIASQSRSIAGGRITSFFDHLSPLYPAINGGREPANLGDSMLLFNGRLVPEECGGGNSECYDYSGHPGYDYAPLVRGDTVTPVFAAADGWITFVGSDSYGNLTVKIRHTVSGIGDFQTSYLHLRDDEVFAASKELLNEPVRAGTRIGTMGTTGQSTGVHLHFEVRFDEDGDGKFDSSEYVDPYGFIPTVEYPKDTWPVTSLYLWKHPLGIGFQVPGGNAADLGEGKGGSLDLTGSRPRPLICAPPDSLPQGGTLFFSWSLSPPATADYVNVGNAIIVSVQDAQLQIVGEFGEPVRITIPFSEEDLANIEANSLGLYRLDEQQNGWERLRTDFDYSQGIASALTGRPGQYVLLGKPTVDQAPPRTEFVLSGPMDANNMFYDDILVTLAATDAQSEVVDLQYQINGGRWQTYENAFILPRQGIPLPLPENSGDICPYGSGRYLILAQATDSAGNVEDPPAKLCIAIDPSKSPP